MYVNRTYSFSLVVTRQSRKVKRRVASERVANEKDLLLGRTELFQSSQRHADGS